ncbi:protein RepS-like [Polyergus mexicanus]|uniref:protein RepS-like n=1 Tax=Polyergus mexicanus TaxID=615972 RepID=UPI0038B65CC2
MINIKLLKEVVKMAELTKTDLHKILRCVLHNGLTELKVKNSKRVINFVPKNDTDKKGSIAGFRTKESMKSAKGFPISSYEALFENDNKLTHWTPNEFSWLGYTEDKQHLKGHYEKNLNQINSFVIDIDFKNKDERDAQKSQVMQSLLLGYVILPTVILKTDKGYQVYYVLDKPAFVNRRGDRYPVLEVAKMISQNIKDSIKQNLGQVDVGCNNFGIFRIPRQDNVIYFEPEMTYGLATFLDWSKSYYQQHRPDLNVVKKAQNYGRQMDQPWFDWLLHKTNIKPGMGIGRHNTVLTLALACYSSKMNEQACYDLLDEFNTKLKVSLEQHDLDRCIKDAYSGVYQGASSVYIESLIETWATSEELKILKQTKKTKNWYKFAKPRSERKYSHKKEWTQDILELINNVSNSDEANEVFISTRTIQAKLGIAPSSLNRALKSLKTTNKLIVKRKKGNNANGYLTLKMLVKALIKSKEQLHGNLLNRAGNSLEEEMISLENKINTMVNGSLQSKGFGYKEKGTNIDLSTKHTG